MIRFVQLLDTGSLPAGGIPQSLVGPIQEILRSDCTARISVQDFLDSSYFSDMIARCMMMCTYGICGFYRSID